MPSVDVYYHFLPPDDVVSARHFADLAEGLQERGWKVRVFGSNRSCRSNGASYPLAETINKVEYNRTWRPDFPQNRAYGRIANAIWMCGSWASKAIWEQNPPDVMITGTDPIFSVASSLAWKATFPHTKLVHWCFDLYPDALFAEGIVHEKSPPGKGLKSISTSILQKQDILANLGPCMADRLSSYAPRTEQMELTPWALVEPDSLPTTDSKIRSELFGSAKLGLLYSGSFGRAHCYEDILALARKLRNESISFCFAVRGNRVEQLKAAINPEDTNIRFAGFASEADLEKRLAAADIHIASLNPEWTGCVVPSKFFGSLAIGRPVLFSGSPKASPARWAESHKVGWTLTSQTVDPIAKMMSFLAANPLQLGELQQQSIQAYQTHFSKKSNLDRLDTRLRMLIQSSNN